MKEPAATLIITTPTELLNSDVNDFDNRADHMNPAKIAPRFYDN